MKKKKEYVVIGWPLLTCFLSPNQWARPQAVKNPSTLYFSFVPLFWLLPPVFHEMCVSITVFFPYRFKSSCRAPRKSERQGALTFASVIARLLPSVVVTGTAVVVVVVGGGCVYEVGSLLAWALALNTHV